MTRPGAIVSDRVDYISGRTRLFGIVGHPIEQVRSPEMFTAELRRRSLDAILVPLHILPDDFDTLLPQLMRLRNLDGVIFTIPYKLRACALAGRLGDRARIAGALNALAARIASAFPRIEVTAGAPNLDDIDILLNATPAGMLDDARLPIAIATLPSAVTVLDAIVKPETTPLLALAERCGCTTVRGREMMRGQISRIVDFFLAA